MTEDQPTGPQLRGAVSYLEGDDAEKGVGPGRAAAWEVVEAAAKILGDDGRCQKVIRRPHGQVPARCTLARLHDGNHSLISEAPDSPTVKLPRRPR